MKYEFEFDELLEIRGSLSKSLESDKTILLKYEETNRTDVYFYKFIQKECQNYKDLLDKINGMILKCCK